MSAPAGPGPPSGKKDGTVAPRFVRRATSPNIDATRRASGVVASSSGAVLGATLANARPPPLRAREKFVPLPDANAKPQVVVEEDPAQLEAELKDDELAPLPAVQRGRITVVTAAESFDRKALEAALKARTPGATVTAYPEVLYVRTPHGESLDAAGEIFFFDYGIVAFWGMTEAQEQELLAGVLVARGAAAQVVEEDDRQVEEMLFVYSQTVAPNIRNDTFTINSRQAADHQVKMAISHALAQSAKLSMYEEKMVCLVEEVRHIPREMAERGAISLSRSKVAQLMGKVFLLKAAVNLTATMLDTPEFFWRAPDQLQTLYERACSYLDIEGRLDMLNARFMVVQRMLDIWSDHSAHQHLARLDVVIVVLILIEVLMAAVEVVGFIMRQRGWHYHGPTLWDIIFGRHRHTPSLAGMGGMDVGMGMGGGLDGGLGGAGMGAAAGWM